MHEIDQWILVRAEDLVTRCRAWYENFEFHKVYHAVYAFATVDLSNIYFDVLKDRLYTSAKKSQARRSAQTALYRLLDSLVRLLAPLMSFTAEEVWTHMNRPGSVHTAYFPEPAELTDGLSAAARERTGNWDRLIEIRGDVLKSLETARNEKLIGAPLEAHLTLSANGDLLPLLEEYAGELPGLFIVSQVKVSPLAATDPVAAVPDAAPAGGLAVTVSRASGEKCERCWKYTGDTGSDARYPTVCACCAAAIDESRNG